MLAVAAGLATLKSRSALPVSCSTPNAGTVVSGTEGTIGPGALFAISTAVAPAAAALLTLIENEQVPRRTTAMAPAKVSAGYAAQPSAAVSMPGLTRSGVVAGYAAVWPTPLAPVVRMIAVSGSGTGAGPVTDIRKEKPARPCWAAAVEDTQGSTWPSVPGPGPLLPAEAATKTPASTALRTASDTASPHGWA